MKRFIVTSFVLLVLILSVPRAYSQVQKGFSRNLTPIQGSIKLREYAALYYDMGDYQRALPMYEQLSYRYPGRIEFLYRTGVCYIYKPGGNKFAIKYLEKVLHLEPEKEGVAFHLGKAFHGNSDFDLGIKYFDFLLDKKTLAKTDRELIERLRQSCLVGKELVANSLDILISNMGAPINSPGIEYLPLLSADESTLVFTYKMGSAGYSKELLEGEMQHDDIYIAHKKNGIWAKPESISSNINSVEADEAAVGISADGRQLFILKYSEETSGDIYMSKLVSGEWTKPVKLKGEINTDSWEGTASISTDGKFVYFDSEREGGYGGTDIYRAELQSDGSWGNVKNLGETINTPFNDEAAFIQSGSKTLFFSSDGHKTMGGFDIFKSTMDAKGNWSKPENLGYPINSTGNDKYYFGSIDGKRGYYHRNKSSGYGDFDLYMINYDLPAKVPTRTADADQSGGEEPVVASSEEVKPSKVAARGESEKDKSMKEEKSVPLLAIAAKSPISISGSLLTSGARPTSFSKAKISLLGDDKRTIAETTSDSKGKFSFTNLSGNDNYEIIVVIEDTRETEPVSSGNASKSVDNASSRKSEARTMAQQPRASSSGSGELKIVKHAVCSSIVDRSPKGESSSFSSDIGKIWFYTEVSMAMEDEETITHKWYLKGQEVSSVDLQVKGPRWRTFSYKSVDNMMKGSWKVQAVSSNGTVLANTEFKVE